MEVDQLSSAQIRVDNKIRLPPSLFSDNNLGNVGFSGPEENLKKEGEKGDV